MIIFYKVTQRLSHTKIHWKAGNTDYTVKLQPRFPKANLYPYWSNPYACFMGKKANVICHIPAMFIMLVFPKGRNR